jgi:hypothetical protein
MTATDGRRPYSAAPLISGHKWAAVALFTRPSLRADAEAPGTRSRTRAAPARAF